MRAGLIILLAVLFYGCDKSDGMGNGGVLVTAPAPPSSLTGTATSSTNVNLTWMDNANNETGFRIERKMLSNSYVQIVTLPMNTTSYADGGVIAATTYTYRIYSFNSAGNSPFSAEFVVTTP